MSKKIIFMFSGQGSQYYKMGKNLYEENKCFEEWMNKLNHMTSDVLGESICNKIYNSEKKKHHPFDRTLYSHLAIFMLEYSMAQTLIYYGIEPYGVLGVSMGEFAAAAVAGVLKLQEAIYAVMEQAIQIEENCENGVMYAVLEDKSIYQNIKILYENSELAAVNYGSHFVISIKKKNTEKLEKFFNEKNICYEKLPVTHAFHSSLMDPAEESYEKVINNLNCKKPNVLFYSSVYADILDYIPKKYFWEIARKPIFFQKVMQCMKDNADYMYIDLGPSGTLSNFVKYNLGLNNKVPAFPVITPFGNEIKNLKAIENFIHDSNF